MANPVQDWNGWECKLSALYRNLVYGQKIRNDFCLQLVLKYMLLLKELCHDILSHFGEVKNHLQTEKSLKIIVY